MASTTPLTEQSSERSCISKIARDDALYQEISEFLQKHDLSEIAQSGVYLKLDILSICKNIGVTDQQIYQILLQNLRNSGLLVLSLLNYQIVILGIYNPNQGMFCINNSVENNFNFLQQEIAYICNEIQELSVYEDYLGGVAEPAVTLSPRFTQLLIAGSTSQHVPVAKVQKFQEKSSQPFSQVSDKEFQPDEPISPHGTPTNFRMRGSC